MLLAIIQTPVPTPAQALISGTIDWITIITVAMAFFSLLISIVTYHETVGSKYSGAVYPSSQIILSWIVNKPCVITDCLFINRGAKPGYVEDIILILKDESGSGTTTTFKASMLIVENDFDALAEEDEIHQRVKNYSPVWLNSKESIKHTIIFEPYNCIFDILTPTSIKEELIIRSFDPKATNSAPWINSGVSCNYVISANNLADWKNAQVKKSVSLESTHLIEKRTNLFKSL